jgi:hypothetical protein
MKLHKIIKNTFPTLWSFVYKLILPIFNLTSFLVVSPQINRLYLFDSPLIDLVARIWISFSFCYGYIFLEKFGNTIRDSNRFEYIKIENRHGIILIRAILLGVSIALITNWLVLIFFPSLKDISLLVGFFHGFIFSLPIGSSRNVFKNI